MKIVILGNGFDLASKLPTKYEDYFNYYENINKNQLEQMICTLFTGHPVRRVFLCVTVMSIS